MKALFRPLYLDKIRPFIGKPYTKVLTGMRRVGKSSLLKLIIEELLQAGVPADQILYINKKSLEWDFLRNDPDPYQYLKPRLSSSLPHYLFIDEVQEVTG